MANEHQAALIRSLKNPAEGADGARISIRNRSNETIGFLRPITRHLALNDETVGLLCRWRERNKSFFLSQYENSSGRTRQWLNDVLLPDDARILFLVETESGEPLGTSGVSSVTETDAELGNVLRGRRGGPSQLFFFGEIALLSWCFWMLAINRMYLNVFCHNSRALDFYGSIGFSRACVRALTKHESEAGTEYRVDSTKLPGPGEVCLMTMDMSADDFRRRYPWMIT